MNEIGDRAIIETARSALDRSAAASHEAFVTEPDAELAIWHLVSEFHADACAITLTNLDPTRPLSPLASRAMETGRHALHVEAGGWRHLAGSAVDDRWRSEFEARANETERQADNVLRLHQRLFERDRAAEREAER